MKKVILFISGFVFVAFLAIFAVALFGQALQGNPYAIALGVAEIVLVVLPMVIDERKLPHWVSVVWTCALYAWFALTILWIIHEVVSI